jgi:glycerate dehydrogenase
VRIVVLDGHTLNPGDLDWEAIHALGECTIHPRTAACDVVSRAQDAEFVFTNKTLIDGEAIRSLPKLRYIGVLATGYNIVDVRTAHSQGVVVTNVPSYGTRSVAQHVFALLLELTQRAGHHSDTVREGRWTQSPDFCYWDYPLIELDGMTMGILGIGRIGQAVADLATAFGMSVIAYSRRAPTSLASSIQMVELDRLFSESDVLSLHCPLNDESKEIVNARSLSMMKRSSYLINTSRGPLVNELDLAAALNSGRIAGAGLDVLAIEPPKPDNPLLKARNCLVTPHIAWATRAARQRLMSVAIENLRSFLDGQPVNVVG